MPLYTVSYDLSNPGRDYESLSNAIKSYAKWWHQTGSTWVIYTTNTDCVAIRDYLKQFVDNNDKIFVARLSGEWAGYGFTQGEYDWIKRHN